MAATGLQTASRLLLIAGVFACGAWLQANGLPDLWQER